MVSMRDCGSLGTGSNPVSHPSPSPHPLSRCGFEAPSSIAAEKTLLRSRGVKATAKQSLSDDCTCMHYVYLLRSVRNPRRVYIGMTTDLERRIEEHNRGDSIYSKRFTPWKLETYIAFSDKALAASLEKYLKSGSGHAFLKKRLLPKLRET